MKKLRNNSLTLSFYSLLIALSTATVVSYESDSKAFGSDRSLVLPEEGSKFNDTLIIVGTLDGKLRALDPAQNGMIRWSTAVSDEPLLSSSLSSLQMMKEFTGLRLIPSLDGGLYQFSWDSIEAFPLTADTLLSSSFKLNEGVTLVGGKTINAVGIDPRTGKVRYSCSNDGCTDSNGSSDMLNDVLVIKRTQKTVRAVSERTGAERWNFSVGQHKLNYVNDDQREQSERLHEERSKAKPNIQVSIPEGLVVGVQKQSQTKDEHLSNNVLWKNKFDTPVAAVWLLEDGMIEKLDLLEIAMPPKSLTESDIPLMYYVGSHFGQLYIHPSDAMEEAVKIAIEKTMSRSYRNDDHALVEQPRGRIIWKPYLVSSPSRTPAIVGKTELAVRKPLDYPFDNGHYFYGQLPNPTSDDPKKCLLNNTNSSSINSDSQKSIFLQLKKSVLNWWRELIILLFTIGFFARQMYKYWYKSVGLSNTVVDINVSGAESALQDGRKREDSKSSLSSSSVIVLSQENFVSRYQYDFEHQTCLGKGAFGLVFQARNKLDDCEYAVKRIRLPNNHKARDKVMREVKVLATLDHPGIVRYYNSWFEEPPVEWLKDWDEKLKGDSLCPTLSSFPSLTGKSEEHSELLELSVNDQSFTDDEENLFQHSSKKGSRKRLDTLTIENENSYETLKSKSSGVDSSGTFNLEFRPHSYNRSSSNNNGRKINDESSIVVFENTNSLDKDIDDNCSNSFRSKHESTDTQSSSVKDNSSLHFLYIQMQLCCRDSLKDWLNSNVENRDYSVSINIFKQLVMAVDYIHSKGHIHRDLKPSNILFAQDGAVKVGDFGLVAACQPCVMDESDSDESKESSNQNLTGQVGTQMYMSPEQVYSSNYCSRVDIFSLGIIFFELFHVFKTQMERLNVLADLRKRNIPETFRKQMPLQSELVLWLLAENPKDRPSAQEISFSQLFLELLNKLTQSPTSS